jgi:hypothetical protein
MKQQESVKVICDKGCGKSFVCSKPQEKKLGDGVIEHMLKCPYCRREYPIFYSNIESRRLRQRLNSKEGKALPPKEREAILTKMNAIESRLRDRFQEC